MTRPAEPRDLSMFVQRRGSGPVVLFVHGDADSAPAAFYTQLKLAERWTLLLPDRPGYGRTPAAGTEDFERDARLLCGLMARHGRVHLVGHSYGGLICLLAAARQPDLVRSLTVIEPPAFSVARGVPAVDRMERDNRALLADLPDDPADRVRAFFAVVGLDRPVTTPLPPALERLAGRLGRFRGPWEAEVPVEDLAASGIPAMVVTCGRTKGFEAIADVLGERLGARRLILPDADHAVQLDSDFNGHLEGFLTSVHTAGERAAHAKEAIR